MKAVVLGADGQLGREVIGSQPADVECIAVNRHALDVTLQQAVHRFIRNELPDMVINCAGYTAVDGAETKPDLALSINAEAVAHIAVAAEQVNARLIHVSTDFVFDGEAATPYSTEAETRPLGAYGHSKLAGEMRLQALLPLTSVTVRTSWLYSSHGGNFVKTMLRLMSERSELRVVCDQIGCPTWARGLAGALWQFREHPRAHGVYHWSDAGSCSWYEFATEIYRLGRESGLLIEDVDIAAIPSEEYPTPAARPSYSVLDSRRTHELLGTVSADWKAQLKSMMEEYL